MTSHVLHIRGHHVFPFSDICAMLLIVVVAKSSEPFDRVRDSHRSIKIEGYMERLCSRRALASSEWVTYTITVSRCRASRNYHPRAPFYYSTVPTEHSC